MISRAVALVALAAAFLWGHLEPGPYAVVFRTIDDHDSVRSWNGQERRPIRISIWYPAAPVDSGPMRYGDYLDANDRESWVSDLTEVAPNGRDIAARLFDTSTAAHRDADPAPGRFPLVLYSPGLGARGDSNAELAEFLASHGYVVATVPNLGPSPSHVEMGNSPGDLEAHTRDVEFAWNRLQTLAFVDASKVATAGHSAGGIVALYLAMRHQNVKAVVSLDGSFGFVGHVKSMTELPQYSPARVTATLLDLRRANHVQGATHDRIVVHALRNSDRYLVSFPRMFHGDFTEFAPIAFLLSVPLPPNDDGRTRRTGFEGNQHAYRAALDFLDARIRGHREGIQRMQAEIASASGATLEHLRR